MIKKAVKEVIHEEKLDIFLKSLPAISDKEMRDIEKFYGHKPQNVKQPAKLLLTFYAANHHLSGF